MTRRVVITGLGTISPLGQDVTTTWEGLVEGRSAIGPITRFDVSDLRAKVAAEVKEFDPVGHGQRTGLTATLPP